MVILSSCTFLSQRRIAHHGTLILSDPFYGKLDYLCCQRCKLIGQIVLFVALGSLTYGYCASIIATTLGQPSFVTYFELDTRSNAADLIGAINGLFQAGGLVGALSCSQTADWLGRRKAILVASVVSVIGGALQAGSVNIAMYIAMRFVTGLGIGTSSLHTLFDSD